MAVSVCPKCDGREFESSTDFENIFTRCTRCSHIVEVIEHYNAGEIVDNQGEQIEELSNRLSVIKYGLTHPTSEPEE